MDCNPIVQLIHICMPVQEWTAIPESKIPQVFFSGTKMNEPYPPPPPKHTHRRPKQKKTHWIGSINRGTAKDEVARWMNNIHLATPGIGIFINNKIFSFRLGHQNTLSLDKSPRREVVRSSVGAGVVYPPFWGHSRSIPQGMIFDVQPLVKSLFCPIRPSPNGFFYSEASIP